MNSHHGPIGAQGKFIWPLDNHDSLFGENILEAEGFEIVEITHAIQIHVIHTDAAVVFVDEGESRAGNFVFLGGASDRPGRRLPLTIPFVSVVFPAPRSPESKTKTGALSCAPISRPC